ncbi:hypothetical protein BgiMline_027129 [Biomphalaria glabrata]|uniref:Uncharacterized protein LOC106073248 n=1 Tax=Biomphalaria glabrata TaxID=6526 RepID=A0A2C9M376_BIOGL|nr:uncharacterized protein LOC106073248 [Biomphalaria glabrata]KAI8739215.1 hypothetical protein BgiBS90_035369 [Biomphalaria glabrata]
MVDLKAVLAVTVLTVLITSDRTAAHPPFFRPFGYPLPPPHVPLPPVRLTVHAPVSGAQIQHSRGNIIRPLINPGFVPVAPVDPYDKYIVTDQDYYAIGGNVGGQIIAFPNDIDPGYVKYDKPDVDFIRVAPGPY